MSDADLWRKLGQQMRVDAVVSAAKAGSGHPTSAMSGADLMRFGMTVKLAECAHRPSGTQVED